MLLLPPTNGSLCRKVVVAVGCSGRQGVQCSRAVEGGSYVIEGLGGALGGVQRAGKLCGLVWRPITPRMGAATGYRFVNKERRRGRGWMGGEGQQQ